MKLIHLDVCWNFKAMEWSLLSWFCCGYSGLVAWLVRQTTQLEVTMNSVERMVEYLKFDSEKDDIIPDNRPDADWPSKGAINVENLRVKYRPELDDVLKGITFSVAAREKIGVCGRTGRSYGFCSPLPIE